jgi:hypothetical protein
MLQELVSGYTPDPNIVDWIHLSKESGGGWMLALPNFLQR